MFRNSTSNGLESLLTVRPSVSAQDFSRDASPSRSKGPGWIPTRSATPSTALVPQRKVGFPIPNAGLLLGFQGTKTARRKGISSPFSDPGGCTSPQNSGLSSILSSAIWLNTPNNSKFFQENRLRKAIRTGQRVRVHPLGEAALFRASPPKWTPKRPSNQRADPISRSALTETALTIL